MKYFQFVEYEMFGGECNNVFKSWIAFQVADECSVKIEHLIRILRMADYSKAGLHRKQFSWEIDLFELSYKGEMVGRFDEIDKAEWERLEHSTWSLNRFYTKRFSIGNKMIRRLK